MTACRSSLPERRHFLRQAASFAGAMLAVSARRIQAHAKAPADKFFDIHTHLGTTWNGMQPLSAEELLRWMDAHQIAQAAVLPLVSPESSSYPIPTAYVLAETQPHRDRLIPFCSVDPRTSYRGGHKGLVAMLKTYVEAGAKGFGEHKPGVPIDDPRNMALYAACTEVKLPVLFHLDEQRNMDAPRLPGLERVLKAFPQVNFIGHGPGWWASISGGTTPADLGGYPRGTVNSGGAIDRLMQNYTNIYADLSAGSGAGALNRDPKFGREFLVRRADRVLFGTDFLAPGQDVPQFEVLDTLDLPADVASRVFRENARKLLGLA